MELYREPISDSELARILLCDDSASERAALAHYLRGRGYHVDEAGDGASAIRYLERCGVDLMLLDLKMPDIDGFGVLRYAQKHRPELPIILLSGMGPDEIQHKMTGSRLPELPPLLMKPINLMQLVGVVELKLAGELP